MTRLLEDLARLSLDGVDLGSFRAAVLERLAREVPHDVGLFHAFSPRVPISTAALRGVTAERVAATMPRWDDLAVSLQRFVEVALGHGGLACDDEALPARGEARRAFEQLVSKPLGVRAVALLHLRRGGRIFAAVLLGRRTPFSPSEREVLRSAIPVIALGDLFWSSPSREVSGMRERLQCLDRRLTPRQREIVEHVAMGHTNQTIAQALGLSPNTLRNHLARVFERLGASNRADVVRLAVLQPQLGTNVPRRSARRRRT